MLMKTSSYYPYGGLMGSGSMGVQPYKYGGKELDRENGLDLYDSHARMYDPIIGRTTTSTGESVESIVGIIESKPPAGLPVLASISITFEKSLPNPPKK